MNDPLADEVATWRTKVGLTAKQLQLLLGVTPAAWYRWLKGGAIATRHRPRVQAVVEALEATDAIEGLSRNPVRLAAQVEAIAQGLSE